MSYNPPTGPPPNWSDSKQLAPVTDEGAGQSSRGYAPQGQPQYQQGYGGGNPQQGYGGGYQQGYGGAPPQGGYGGGYQQGYGGGYPQGGGYYQQQPQQQYYVQQKQSSGNESCLMACLAGLCICCTLDMLF